jgi:hypothetical protein
MDEYILNKINLKYDSELVDYKYCEFDNIIDIPRGTHIKYISKKNLIKKSGFIKDIKDNSILELINVYRKTKWFIYTEKYYIFYKFKNSNSLKGILKQLVDNNFSVKKI